MLGWVIGSGPYSLSYGFSHRPGWYEICTESARQEVVPFYALFGSDKLPFLPPF